MEKRAKNINVLPSINITGEDIVNPIKDINQYHDHIRFLIPTIKLKLEDWVENVCRNLKNIDTMICFSVKNHYFIMYYNANQNNISVFDSCRKWKLNKSYVFQDRYIMPICRGFINAWKLDNVPIIFTNYNDGNLPNVNCMVVSFMQRLKVIESKGKSIIESGVGTEECENFKDMVSNSDDFYSFLLYHSPSSSMMIG